MSQALWDRDDIQFPRLLDEIQGIGLTDTQYVQIAESMDLTPEEVHELFERAQTAWDKHKAEFFKGLPPIKLGDTSKLVAASAEFIKNQLGS